MVRLDRVAAVSALNYNGGARQALNRPEALFFFCIVHITDLWAIHAQILHKKVDLQKEL